MKKTLLLLGSAAALTLVAWLWLERSTRPDAPAPDSTPGIIARSTSTPPPPPTFVTPADSAETLSSTGNASSDLDLTTAAPDADPAAYPVTAESILAEPDEDLPRVAKKLAALVKDPRAPLEVREDALSHAINLSAGNESEIIDPLATDANVPDSMAETILVEALNRSLTEQIDLYLASLSVRTSPEMQALIREHLAFLTDSPDLGPNAAAWLAAVNAAKQAWAE